ncbi:MAG TPA: ABC transporter permease [Kiritimatiellia bacterium]|nr:ABC transporter permease [Kiritimatiellia bacterium]
MDTRVSSPLIEIREATKVYHLGDNRVHALRGVSLTVEAGDFVAIMGASGSGKSTLMHILGLLDVPDSGSYRLNGRELSACSEDELARIRNEEYGFVFQQFNLLSRTTAIENTALPLLYSRGGADDERVRELLRQVGLGDRLEHNPNELSGGQQQRVAIARALTTRPRVILADEPTGNLDSASAHEIMTLLKRLNEQGITILLVTHETDIADYARRVIHMKDGRVLREEVRCPARTAQDSEEKPAAAQPGWRHDARAFATYFRLAWRALWAHKLRAFLSMLGILIGVASVIAMLGIGAGAREAISTQFSSLGSNLLVLRPGARISGGVRMQAGQVSRLTTEDARAIRERIPGIRRTSATVSTRGQVVAQGRNWNTEVTGVEPDHAEIRALQPDVGRYVTEEDLRIRARVAVIGRTLVRELFNGQNPIGQEIRINRVIFSIVGVLPEKGSSPWRDRDDVIIIPLSTAMYRLAGREHVDAIEMEIADARGIPAAQEAVMTLMRQRQRTPPGAPDGVQVQNMAEMLAALTETSRTMSVLLATIAAISLVVGGIGIMNIMLVSVTERVREIGIRKAVGARRRDILGQFLVEAVAVSVTGGLLGMALGAGVAYALSTFAGWAVTITPQAVAMAFGFSALTGLVFGIWPARKAALLNPIDALRYE